MVRPLSRAALTVSIATRGWWQTLIKTCWPRLAFCAEITKPDSGVISMSFRAYWEVFRSSSTLEKLLLFIFAAELMDLTITFRVFSMLAVTLSVLLAYRLLRWMESSTAEEEALWSLADT